MRSTAIVLSVDCTHIIPDLMELPAGVPTEIPANLLGRALALPGVTQLPTPTAPPPED